MARVLVIGSINMDLVVSAARFPGPGETVLGQSFSTFPGGKGANQAVAAARLGADIGFIARIGQDAIGAQMYAGFQADGMDVQGVSVDPKLPTGIAIIYVADHGKNSIGI